jgi:hypothetical protein
MKVYLLSEKGDDWTVIGVYSSREKAAKAQDRSIEGPPSTISEGVVVDAPAEYLKPIVRCERSSCFRCNPKRSRKTVPSN